MLGLYLDTLKLGHNYCNMLSLCNELTWLKELQTFVTKVCFFLKSKNITTTKHRSKHKIISQSRESNPGPLAPQLDNSWISGSPSQLKVPIVVKLFNCYHAIGRNVNKQSQFCGPHIFNKFIFSVVY